MYLGSLAAPPVGFTLRQQTSTIQATPGGSQFSPTTVTLTGVLAGSLILTCGGWWDGNANTGGTTPVPTDTNGTLVKAYIGADPSVARSAAPTNPQGSGGPDPRWPVNSQLCHILSASAGTHVFSPPDIWTGGGDGYFFAMEFSAPGKTWSLVDAGNGFAGSLTPGAVDGCTATTNGTAAQVGDLIVCSCAVDGDPTSIGFNSPSGYIDLYTNLPNSAVNANMGTGYKAATANGAQSAAFAWADNACQVARAVIAAYRAS